MLDVKFIRENKDIVAAGAKKKRIEVDLDRLIALDDKRRELQAKIDEKRAEQNAASNAIATARSDAERQEIIARMQDVKETLRLEEESMQEILKEWRSLMVQVPNIPDISVPEGDSDADNKEVRRWPAQSGVEGGEPVKFDFEPKSHTELLLLHDMADYERGAKVSGFRGYFLKNDGARMVWALERFVQDRFADKGFTPMIVPSLVRREAFIGTGYLPQGEDDLYKTQDGEYLAGTAEVATMGYYMDETLDKNDLPLKFFSFSPCYRREAGSHGKDAKGIFRIHEFLKYEQVVLCEASHEESARLHEEITANAEELLQELGLPYRVVINCGADLGLGQVKKFDVEAWMPSEKKYRETHSSSYFHDFQTRRLNIRYRGEDGALRYAHSLNNTALATPRILCQIVENNQRPDGSIAIPKALQSCMGKETIDHGPGNR
ncbi:serine--tRNA ligase [Candidatus Kaiserbacteria bacterium RIFCSPHIGHO2_02_FULL_59_21]|uniref:Serine--tRNA ligase n=2 Tax=Candidatus Kaiseribacteriota TaxID=1752734 RepID=A0A0G1YT33_9BACT|nr:MAG: Serine-tRNA ligase [Candidatus Kaiserbacteria bacterium GW2011_GWA2_58_9]OGG62447.1 MAG: serine--tRNA ligase [Candidatus Kaiserbacteria bacterium RIFCSPHIGHO2_01_FULL_58_22]OGG67567.1 MAG: serine--tRNA ligase [Candidatus Kaiserbacteria bacterium RIFCSPHIGHO2_02_FULL_59_21]OGG80171.1 MAG: serine--tRNA ligase [Candidatus Kaiserbacteria bacterium RIFCSPLOWO2_01_FULL_59_34]OGG86962.1 MAG: serine--tRNA ligase [Candidatus Kaiserbacteria bacterium RIFCSPLOWO2_02_FULL_59_19]